MTRHLAVFLFFAALFAWRVEETRIGSGYLDPVGGIQAQDEAVYSSAAIRMADHGGWMTPMFMERFFLYKPPLVYWLSGLSAKALGIRNRNLRLPAILAGAAVCAVIANYWGWLAAALVAANPLFFTMSRRNMTDALLCAAILAVAAALWRDPKLDRRGNRILAALGLGAAILAKSTAGVIPAAILIVAAAASRIPLRRVIGVLAVAGAIAAPWFVYQYTVNPRWFWAEFVEVELLAYGAGAPPQATGEAGMAFYARRLWTMDPLLCLLALSGMPALLAALRRDARAAVAGAWLLLLTLALAAYQYRNATYLLPAIPVLAIIGTRHLPIPETAARLAAVCLLAARIGWSGYYSGDHTLAGVELIEERCRSGRTNDLLIAGIPDQFYATVLPGGAARYLLPEAELPPKGFSLDFQAMGVILPVAEYARLGEARAKYEPMVRGWGLPGAGAIGAVISYRDWKEVAELMAAVPGTDFLVPEAWVNGRAVKRAGGMALVEGRNVGNGRLPSRACRM